MRELRISADWSYRGLRVISLENRMLRLLVLPEAGGKIWQISYKPFDADLLWNNPRIPPAGLAIGSSYDDSWSGGWDELFPNDEAATIGGEAYPDHGELWTGRWNAEPFSTADEVGVKLHFVTPVSSIQVEKTIVLGRGASRLCFRHKFTNVGGSPFQFLWKLHPAFAVTPEHRIDFPPMKVRLEPAFPGSLGGAAQNFDWPTARVDGRDVDLRQVSSVDQRQLYFFYGTEVKDGWCALTNTATGLSCGLKFDPAVFPCNWLFATYGGWRNYNVAVLEPCTGYPLNFEAMRTAGRQRTLAPGESLNTEILFSVQEGITAVERIRSDGTIVQGPS
jgi:hypothetical protein